MGTKIYLKIKEELLTAIVDMPANSPIASERELAARYQASRMTVRNAVNELVEEGILYRDKNKGTYVADQKLIKKNTSAEAFNKDEAEHNDFNVIYFSAWYSDKTITPHLEIGDDDWMIRVVRLNRSNGRPQSMEELYFIQHMIGEGDFNNLDKLLNLKAFVEEGSVTQRFLPVTVPVKYINLLHMKLNTPIILVESTIVSKSGSPIVYIREYVNPFEKTIEITM